MNIHTPKLLLVGAAIDLAVAAFGGYRFAGHAPLAANQITTVQAHVSEVEEIRHEGVRTGFLFVQSALPGKFLALRDNLEAFDVDQFLIAIDEDKAAPFVFQVEAASLQATQGAIGSPIRYARVVGAIRGDRRHVSLDGINAALAVERSVGLMLLTAGVASALLMLFFARKAKRRIAAAANV